MNRGGCSCFDRFVRSFVLSDARCGRIDPDHCNRVVSLNWFGVGYLTFLHDGLISPLVLDRCRDISTVAGNNEIFVLAGGDRSSDLNVFSCFNALSWQKKDRIFLTESALFDCWSLTTAYPESFNAWLAAVSSSCSNYVKLLGRLSFCDCAWVARYWFQFSEQTTDGWYCEFISSLSIRFPYRIYSVVYAAIKWQSSFLLRCTSLQLFRLKMLWNTGFCRMETILICSDLRLIW